MDKIYYIPTSKKVMSLTFDDGVDSYTTPIILNILKKYNIKATFFVLIANILKNPKILQQLIDDGHSVQLHGWNHRSWQKYPKRVLERHIRQCMDILKTSFSVVPQYVRPPFGTLTKHCEMIFEKFNLSPIGWSICIKDYYPTRTNLKTNDLLNQISPGKIMLLHDGCRTNKHFGDTTEILNNVLPILINEYKFVLIPELINLKTNFGFTCINKIPLLHHEIIHINNKYYLILYWDINFSDPNKSFVLRIINPSNAQKIISKYPNPLSMNEWPQQIEIDPIVNNKKIIFVESENNFVQLK